jgi:hypothetical protein
MTPSVVGDGLAMLPKSIFNLFKKKESKEPKVDADE